MADSDSLHYLSFRADVVSHMWILTVVLFHLFVCRLGVRPNDTLFSVLRCCPRRAQQRSTENGKRLYKFFDDIRLRISCVMTNCSSCVVRRSAPGISAVSRRRAP